MSAHASLGPGKGACGKAVHYRGVRQKHSKAESLVSGSHDITHETRQHTGEKKQAACKDIAFKRIHLNGEVITELCEFCEQPKHRKEPWEEEQIQINIPSFQQIQINVPSFPFPDSNCTGIDTGVTPEDVTHSPTPNCTNMDTGVTPQDVSHPAVPNGTGIDTSVAHQNMGHSPFPIGTGMDIGVMPQDLSHSPAPGPDPDTETNSDSTFIVLSACGIYSNE